jgi:WD40 repeat protein
MRYLSQMVAPFQCLMRTVLRHPRVALAVLIGVALVALGVWGAGIVRQSIAYQIEADSLEQLEAEARLREGEASTLATAIQSELDQWRRDTRSPDQLTEQYFTSRLELELLDMKYQQEMVAYHANLKDHYLRASWFPFLSSVPPARDPPPDPLISAPPPLVLEERARKATRFPEGGISVAFSPNGSGLAVGCRDKTIRLLELPSQTALTTFQMHDGEPRSLAFASNGTTLIAADHGRVWQWDLATGHTRRSLAGFDRSKAQPSTQIFASDAAPSPDGRTIGVAVEGIVGNPLTEAFVVRLLDSQTGALKWEHKENNNMIHSAAVAFSPSGEMLACCNGPVWLLDFRTGKAMKTLRSSLGDVMSVAFSPDGRTLAGAGDDTRVYTGTPVNGRVTLWDISTGKILRSFDGPTHFAASVAFSRDGRTIAAGGTGTQKKGRNKLTGEPMMTSASEVRLWDVTTAKLIWSAERETDSAFSLSFSPDGKSLAFCDQEHVYLVAADTGRLKQVVK